MLREKSALAAQSLSLNPYITFHYHQLITRGIKRLRESRRKNNLLAESVDQPHPGEDREATNTVQ